MVCITNHRKAEAQMVTTLLKLTEPLPQEAKEFSDWHERCVEHLLQQSGHRVKREPLMMGKTPDLLATPPGGQPFIVECMARLQDPEHAREMALKGWHNCDGNIRELHRNVYSRLDEKATRYRSIAQEMPYVIALYDATCNNGINTAVDLVLSPYAPAIERDADGRFKGKHYNGLWRTPSIPVALFELYPHLSGLIYSREGRQHCYLPNPYAERPLSHDAFPFAQVPALPEHYQQVEWSPQPATVFDAFEPPPALSQTKHHQEIKLQLQAA